ncbi:MAG: peptide ABC transporter substrate-binding protein [Cellvibrionales bacterium]|nr:peptide ABC transporter substrate-binding protein [Cellvibrionales bacterium]
MIRWRIVALALTATLASLPACTPGESRVESGNRLGIFHIGNGSDPESLDPHVATGIPAGNVFSAIYEGLVVSNPYTLEPEPGVAERWEISADGLRYRFYLRQNARWSNGDPVTAEDFRWTYERYLTPAMGNEWAYMLFPVRGAKEFFSGDLTDFTQVGIRTLGEYSLEIELKNPTPYFLQLLAHSSSAVVHRPTIEAHGSPTARYSAWTRPQNIVTNGPFVPYEWKISRPLKVRKNPHYWDRERLRLNEIHFHPTENATTEERLFRAGQLHKTNTLPTDKVPVYRAANSPALRVQPYLGTYYYQVNTTRPGLSDARVRRALAMSIDRAAISRSILRGTSIPAFSMTPPGTLGYQPPAVFSFDPDKARQLLAEAGYPNGTGFPSFEILYNTSEGHRKVAVAIQQMWKRELNIDVTLTNQEWKVYLDSRDNMDYDIARAGWIGDYVDPLTFLDLGLSSNGNNNTGFADPHYDWLISEHIPAARTRPERLARFATAEAYLLEKMPFIPIYTYQSKYLLDPTIRGLPPNIRDHYNYRYITLGSAAD